MFKKCATCKQDKPLAAFGNQKGTKDGKRTQCKACKKIYDDEYWTIHRERENEQARKRYRKNPEKSSIKGKNWRIKNPTKHTEYHLKLQYGITIKDRNKIIAGQNFSCAICNTPFNEKIIKLKSHTDHDHTTGELRGILCQGCNHGLGAFKDDIQRLQSAVQYLRRYSPQHLNKI